MKTLAPIIISACLLLTVSALAGPQLVVGGLGGIPADDDQPRARVALALSGGGARGLATIGLLRALEENDVEVAAIAGTSMGGVLGGLYACGYTPDELEHFVDSVDFSLLFSNSPKRSAMLQSRRNESGRHLLTIRFDGLRPHIPQALTGAQQLTALLTRLTNKANYIAGGDFTKLPIPFKTTATDVISGELVIMENGSLAEALRSTMAYPLAFTGVRQGDRLLMDGGMILPVPVDIVRDMVSDDVLVIAVNTTSPLLSDDELKTPVDIAGQVTTIMTADKLQRQLAAADVVIAPCNDSITSADFKQRDRIIAEGYRQGQEIIGKLLKLDWRRTGHPGQDTPPVTVARVDVRCPKTSLRSLANTEQLALASAKGRLVDELRRIVRHPGVYQVRASFRPLSEVAGKTTPAKRVESIKYVAAAKVPPPDARPRALLIDIVPEPALSELTWHITGNSLYDDSTLMAQCDFRHPTVSLADLTRARDRIIKLYNDDGYDLTNIRHMALDPVTKTVRVEIDEAIVRRMDVEENDRSKDWLIRSYFPLGEGKPYSTSQADRGLAELYGTELFDRVTATLTPLDTGAQLTVQVREKKHTQLRLGWHWHEDYRSEQFVELLDDNIGGIGLEALVHSQYGDKREDYHAQLRLDRIFFTYLSARLRVHYQSLDRDLYDVNGGKIGERFEDRWGISFLAGQHISRLGMVKAGIVLEELELRDNNRQTFSKLGLRSLYFGSSVETLDQVPFPTSGSQTQLELRLAGKLIGGDVDFTRFHGSAEAYYSLGTLLTYHPQVSLGLSRRGLPSSERFYLGGMHSLSGFRTSELAGDKFVLLNQELRVNLPLKLYLFGRWDVGDVYTSTESIRIKNLRDGFGISVAHHSPIGAIEIGYGGGDSPKDRWYLSAGYRF